MRRKTSEEYEKEIFEKYGNEYSLLTSYTRAVDKIKVRHNPCGSEFYVLPSNLIRHGVCQKCNRGKTNDEFLKEVYDVSGSDFTFLEEYKGSSTPIKVRHNLCGNIFMVRPNDFLRKTPCRYCHGNEHKRKTTSIFKSEIYDLVGDEYTLLSEYTSRDSKVKIRHNKCGKIINITPGNFLCGTRCVECYYNSLRLSEEEVNERIHDCLGTDYKLVSKYVSSQKKSVLVHEECGTKFLVRLDDVFTKHSGCPVCNNESCGEHYIRCFLNENNIIFVSQKRFKGLKDNKPLSYDFYLPEENVVIEYQGSQHYIPKNFGGVNKEVAKENFEKQIYHDQLKRDFAHSNGYTLVEISYKYDSYSKVSDYLEKFI